MNQPVAARNASHRSRPNPHAGANDRIRIGIVGFSDRLKILAAAGLPSGRKGFNCEIVGVSDLWSRRRDEAKPGSQTHGRGNSDLPQQRGTLRKGQARRRDHLHRGFPARAPRHRGDRAGCDVYCEKPFAETMAGRPRRAQSRARASDRVVQIGSQRRSGGTYHAAHEYLKSGKFGPIVAAEMTWNVNQPGRWRRPDLVAAIREQDIDWKRFLMNRPDAKWDPRKYLEYRLFWPYSSGHSRPVDVPPDRYHPLVHRTAAPALGRANGGIYQWKDGRTNFDTLTAVFDYGPLDDPSSGFQVTYSSRFSNSAGGTKEIYYSNGGELNLDTGKVTSNGGLTEGEAAAMKMQPNCWRLQLEGAAWPVTAANTGADPDHRPHAQLARLPALAQENPRPGRSRLPALDRHHHGQRRRPHRRARDLR
jgi:hypothetical protein